MTPRVAPDPAFPVLHTPETEDWTLQVSATRPWDSGTYKCQVNSHPKIFKDVNLSVMDRRRLDNRLYRLPAADPEHGEYATRIVGESSRYLQAGSSLALECRHPHPRPPACPPLVPSAAPSGLRLSQGRDRYYAGTTAALASLEKTRERTTSRLMMSAVQVSDSGNYTCVPIRAPPGICVRARDHR
nr:uncharacterized protein LOC113802266 [Penaeus vannamei]